MDRRRFLLTSLVGAFAWPIGTEAQQRPPSIGVLLFLPLTRKAQDEFRHGFREHGFIEGRNLLVEWRSAQGSTDRAASLAMELVNRKVSIIVAEFTPSIRAAKNATATIPIVMASAGDPVAAGLVPSLGRPSGNVTGFTNSAAELSGKRLELLHEVVPGLRRVGLLINGTDPLDGAFVDATRAAADKTGIDVHVRSVPRPEDLENALSVLREQQVGAVIVLANLPVPSRQIAEAMLRYRFPSISVLNDFAEAGGLMYYGASVSDIRRRVAGYVEKILKGTKPADLPVERPTKFDFVMNGKTARSLGLTIPPSLQARADEVIE